MQIVGYHDPAARRSALAQSLLASARRNSLKLHSSGAWTQFMDTSDPLVMLAIRDESEQNKALSRMVALMKELDALSKNSASGPDTLLKSLNALLDAHPRHHIQL